MTAADEWRVNLDAVDNSDQRTLLDYVATEIERTAKDPRYNGTLRTYHGVLRKLGAKHAREL